MKIPYQEGDWFAVPVKSGFVLARVARAYKGVILGYFFKPVRPIVPTELDTTGLVASDAFYIARFSHLGLLKHGWPVIHRPETWKREEWPVPPFGRLNSLGRYTGLLIFYDDNKIIGTVSTQYTTAEEAMRYPEDGLAGYGFLQNVLEMELTVGYPPYETRDPGREYFWFRGLP